MKNKKFSLAELKRKAKEQKIAFELIKRYKATGDAIPERFRGIRKVIAVNTVSIKLASQTGAVSELQLPRASLIDYDGTYLKVYEPGLREPTDEEKKILSQWETIRKEKTSPYVNTYWATCNFFKKTGFSYLSGYQIKSNHQKRYLPSNGKVLDPEIKGTCILIYRIHHSREAEIAEHACGPGTPQAT